MDKFGIYKLLNSFFDFYQQSSSKKKDDGGGFNLSSLLSLAKNNGFGHDATKNKLSKANETSSANKISTPIQSPLLSAMSQHEEFVKRVKKKSKIEQ